MLTRIKNYSVLTAGDEVVCGCAQREVCHFISNWVGECPSVGKRVENKKEEIRNKERRKIPQSKYDTFITHSHEHIKINVAGVGEMSGGGGGIFCVFPPF